MEEGNAGHFAVGNEDEEEHPPRFHFRQMARVHHAVRTFPKSPALDSGPQSGGRLMAPGQDAHDGPSWASPYDVGILSPR